MLTALCFTVFGYLSGSILFARVYGALFGKDLISNSTDGNPGTSNAFYIRRYALRNAYTAGRFNKRLSACFSLPLYDPRQH